MARRRRRKPNGAARGGEGGGQAARPDKPAYLRPSVFVLFACVAVGFGSYRLEADPEAQPMHGEHALRLIGNPDPGALHLHLVESSSAARGRAMELLQQLDLIDILGPMKS
jgi:hypothetical protein